MKEYSIFLSDLMLELAECFKERLALYIADGTTYFHDGDFCIVA